MRSLKIGKLKEKYYTPGQPISQTDKERRNKAIEIAKSHKDSRPIKYLIKK